VQEGDPYSDEVKRRIQTSLKDATGKEPTDVAAICCDEKGSRLLFIGLPGQSYKRFTYHPEPERTERLPSEIVKLYSRLDRALEAAVRKGGDAAQEDDSNGYALTKDPETRAVELQVRQWALRHEQQLMRVLASSASVEDRRIASDALGYGPHSLEQVLALAGAARDPDDEVRNNATRALGVLVRSHSRFTSEIPTETFIEMLNSGKWTDRNKATALLAGLTEQRDPALLARLRAQALNSLIEMASWRRPSHAYFARVILGRVAGIPEKGLNELAWNGPVGEIVKAALTAAR
jgi:hypothetical protein